MIACAVQFVAMPAKRDKAVTEQAGFRLNAENLKRVRQYANEHPLKPTVTQIVDSAIAEWLDRHEGEYSAPRKGK